MKMPMPISQNLEKTNGYDWYLKPSDSGLASSTITFPILSFLENDNLVLVYILLALFICAFFVFKDKGFLRKKAWSRRYFEWSTATRKLVPVPVTCMAGFLPGQTHHGENLPKVEHTLFQQVISFSEKT